ncbi:MAG TPA: TetR/AcrR family transcriptional regulator, partial [Thermoleophilia bacterium]|nr:TetR/AcrR family transcriptional regulator [Thermoleophilia bacterium]
RRFGLEYRTALRLKTRLAAALDDPEQSGLLREGVDRLLRPCPPEQPRLQNSSEGEAAARLDVIRAAACRVFADRGFDRTRLADVAHEAGVSVAVIRYHYRAKDDLLRAALVWTQERGAIRLKELLQREPHALHRLEGLVDLALPTEREIRDEYLLWLEAWARALGARRFDDDDLFSEWHNTVVEVVRQGCDEGVFAPRHTAEDFGDAFVAYVDGLSFKVVERYEEMPLTRARQLLWQWIDDELGLVPARSLA